MRMLMLYWPIFCDGCKSGENDIYIGPIDEIENYLGKNKIKRLRELLPSFWRIDHSEKDEAASSRW